MKIASRIQRRSSTGVLVALVIGVGVSAAPGTARIAQASGDPATDGTRANQPGSISTLFFERSSAVAAAMHALDTGDVGRAVAKAVTALEVSLARVDRLAALNVICIGLVASDAPGRALPACDRLVRESHGDWRALNNRANARLALGDIAGAVDDYELALTTLHFQPDAEPVRHFGSGLVASAGDTLEGNLAIARRRMSRELRVVQGPPSPRTRAAPVAR